MIVEKTVACPYCGERIGILVDSSVENQAYIEDCQVCCRPIDVQATSAIDGEISVEFKTDSE